MASHRIDITTKACGINIGGKHGIVMPCPVCGRPCVKVRAGKEKGVFYVEYAHNLYLGLNRRNEPECTPGDVCRSLEGAGRSVPGPPK